MKRLKMLACFVVGADLCVGPSSSYVRYAINKSPTDDTEI